MAISRRAVVAGGLAAPLSGLSNSPAEVHRSQASIAREVMTLAERLSALLGQYDGAGWKLHVSPEFRGEPVVSIEPFHSSPEAQLDRAIKATSAALAKCSPGAWRVERSHQSSFLIFIDDDWHKQAVQSDASAGHLSRPVDDNSVSDT